MNEFILSLIDTNQGINYNLVIIGVLAYLAILWIAICIWVYTDARKRYESIIYPIIIFLFVLVFNIPALIFYVMIRPDFTFEEEELLEAAVYNRKKLEPIIFSGTEGFDISLNLRVIPRRNEDGQSKHEMDLDVSWIPTTRAPEETHLEELEQIERVINKSGEIKNSYEEGIQNIKSPVAELMNSMSTKFSSFTIGFKNTVNKLSVKIKEQYLSGRKVVQKVDITKPEEEKVVEGEIKPEMVEKPDKEGKRENYISKKWLRKHRKKKKKH